MVCWVNLVLEGHNIAIVFICDHLVVIVVAGLLPLQLDLFFDCGRDLVDSDLAWILLLHVQAAYVFTLLMAIIIFIDGGGLELGLVDLAALADFARVGVSHDSRAGRIFVLIRVPTRGCRFLVVLHWLQILDIDKVCTIEAFGFRRRICTVFTFTIRVEYLLALQTHRDRANLLNRFASLWLFLF